MRFLIDHDVDVEVCRMLRKAGHQCERAADAIKSTDDDDIAVYAEDHGRVLIALDRAVAERRRKRTFGQHVRLVCSSAEAVLVLSARLDELLDALKAGVGVYHVTKTKVKFFPPRWE